MDSRMVKGNGFTFLECASEKPSTPLPSDITFEDWNKETYDGWKVEGTAFGTGPIKKSAILEYQGDVGGDTERIVNSHASAPGTDVGAKDNATGKLTSRPFKIEHNFINFWIGGGYSTSNAIRIETGIILTQLLRLENSLVRVGYSFDYNISSFGNVFGTSHELTVSYAWN